MNYPQTLEYLYSQLPMFQRIGAAAYKADLGNTVALTEILGHPERKFKSVHVAGTNGKGSVSHLLASILQEAGYKTGLYTSPHLKDFRERIRINGKMVPKEYVKRFVSKNKQGFDQVKPSFFEYTAVMAFDYFAENKVDIAILETGMGGRLDSTNVVAPLLTMITNISMDHTAFLGNTLAAIAVEKAGIIKPDTSVIIGETQEEIEEVFIEKARTCSAPVIFADRKYHAYKPMNRKPSLSYSTWNITRDGKPYLEGLKCPLQGNYQGRNLSTVMMGVEELRKQGFNLEEGDVRQGIRKVVTNTGLLGRWQVLSRNPKIICDVGHNEAGINYILEQLKQEEFRRLHFVFGMVNDKEAANVLKLLPVSAKYYFCKANIPRGRNASELKNEAEKYGLKGEVYLSVKEAFKAARETARPDDLIFVGGSTFVVAEVL
jgi:dihydrofolate synthase/folylpolyglutamate synthase